jgi:hypothetical protein
VHSEVAKPQLALPRGASLALVESVRLPLLTARARGAEIEAQTYCT